MFQVAAWVLLVACVVGGMRIARVSVVKVVKLVWRTVKRSVRWIVKRHARERAWRMLAREHERRKLR